MSDNGNEKLCSLVKDRELKKIAEKSADPQYICSKCCRVAHSKKNLCRSKKIVKL